MDRRTFISTTVATVMGSLVAPEPNAQPVPKTKNVVLIHGLFADGSCWSEVIPRLQAKGIQATAVQNPLTSLQAAVEATQQVLAWQRGPTVLVAHSFGGMILTEAGVDPIVSAVVYVAARAPDAGEDYPALAARFPTPPATAGIIWSDDWGRLNEEAFLRDFCGRPARGEGPRALCGSGSLQKDPTRRQDYSCSVADKAKLVCCVHRRSYDQPGS